MPTYVFNGDADGICALQQLRLAEPRLGMAARSGAARGGVPGGEDVLITGVKRDIALLVRVQARGADLCTVLDVSLDVTGPLVPCCRRPIRPLLRPPYAAMARLPGWTPTSIPAPTSAPLLVDVSDGGAPLGGVGAFGDSWWTRTLACARAPGPARRNG